MKYLIVDAGNSRVKMAVFENQQLLSQESHREEVVQKVLPVVFNAHKIDKTIVSSVGAMTDVFVRLLKGRDVLFLSKSTPLPFENCYQSTETLGVDRMALVSAAALHYPQKNALIIDAGTCVTYELKNAKNEYLGGVISPGLQMRYAAMASQTEKLPLLETQNPVHWRGDHTQACMHSGVVNGLVYEIEGFIRAAEMEFSDLTVVLTGGAGNFLSKRLKNSIFAHPNFLLEGLHAILIHNTD